MKGGLFSILHEKIEGNQYTYDEVKDQIHRQMALEQIQSPVSGKIFWDELDVEWFYGLKKNRNRSIVV